MSNRQVEQSQKIAVAVSGGVDSGVALFLLKQKGYDIIAVFTDYFKCKTSVDSISCCSADSLRRAAQTAEFLNVPFYQMDFRKEFEKNVADLFVEYYNSGRTPNPCVWCNSKLRFSLLIGKLKKIGINYLATGHYAKIINDRLSRATDKKKDQSYFLYDVGVEKFKHIIFPVGEMLKENVYKIAKKNNLPVMDTTESQDCCMLMEEGLQKYLKNKIELTAGEIIDLKGEILGMHYGFQNYTLGQRKGFGGLGKKMYVIDIIPSLNKVVVGNEEDLYKKKIDIKIEPQKFFAEKGERLQVKLRSTHKSVDCKIEKLNFTANICKISFNKMQRAPTPGQSAVLYRKDEVVGGGEIIK